MSDAVQEPEGGIDNTLASAFAQVRQQLAEAEVDEVVDEVPPTRRRGDRRRRGIDAVPTRSPKTKPSRRPSPPTDRRRRGDRRRGRGARRPSRPTGRSHRRGRRCRRIGRGGHAAETIETIVETSPPTRPRWRPPRTPSSTGWPTRLPATRPTSRLPKKQRPTSSRPWPSSKPRRRKPPPTDRRDRGEVAEDEAIEEAFAAEKIEAIVEGVAEDEAAEEAIAAETVETIVEEADDCRGSRAEETIETVEAVEAEAAADRGRSGRSHARKTLEKNPRAAAPGRPTTRPIDGGSFRFLTLREASGRSFDVGTSRLRTTLAGLAYPPWCRASMARAARSERSGEGNRRSTRWIASTSSRSAPARS